MREQNSEESSQSPGLEQILSRYWSKVGKMGHNRVQMGCIADIGLHDR